ncbi:CubicO group peptidase, beta-lactamase class C family [Glycomyces harbinensis]|uniref:CubicO group peptidase, beta-lactamase class C family n=1 Tax=Glycomyces harbinensis TaxID=58114 RepID=A0A1G7AEZ8_9ACTN|nr:serine hydrolase domain-containing protein [Glycomyces harbinensis]SDE13528.1 CubicO group peptidase, beta-lactamase class C family [Glycomyces harbinensis]
MQRRTMLGGAAGAICSALAFASRANAEERPSMPELTGPPTAGPYDVTFPEHPLRLRYGSCGEARLTASHIGRIVPELESFMSDPAPSFPGYTVLAARHGVVVEHRAGGHKLRYESWDEATKTAVELPEDQWEEAEKDTVYDLASISKLFTATVTGHFIDEGLIDLKSPVVEYLPDFDSSDPEKSPITLGHLLCHTSGMIAFINLYDKPDEQARMEAIYAYPLRRPPGSGYEYSDLNLIVLGKVLEAVAGQPLDELVTEIICEPLGLKDTGYNPSEAGRTAATEFQPWTGRGMVRGEVHDENAWAFGGVAGHAGVFATAWDLAVFGQMILNGGRYRGAEILSESTARLVFTDQNAGMGESAARGLGWQLGQRWYMDAMSSPVTVGHTGYTGTSIVLDPLAGTLLVLLTNRVHPTRNWGTASAYRRAASRPMGRAVPVRPRSGEYAWFAGQADDATATLTAVLPTASLDAEASFALWYDTEATDVAALEASPDGEAWTPVPLDLRTEDHHWETDGRFSGFSGRQWIKAGAQVPDGTMFLRWRYTADPAYQGRGVYVDKVKVREGRAVVHDGSALVADGWELVRDLRSTAAGARSARRGGPSGRRPPGRRPAAPGGRRTRRSAPARRACTAWCCGRTRGRGL